MCFKTRDLKRSRRVRATAWPLSLARRAASHTTRARRAAHLGFPPHPLQRMQARVQAPAPALSRMGAPSSSSSVAPAAEAEVRRRSSAAMTPATGAGAGPGAEAAASTSSSPPQVPRPRRLRINGVVGKVVPCILCVGLRFTLLVARWLMRCALAQAGLCLVRGLQQRAAAPRADHASFSASYRLVVYDFSCRSLCLAAQLWVLIASITQTCISSRRSTRRCAWHSISCPRTFSSSTLCAPTSRSTLRIPAAHPVLLASRVFSLPCQASHGSAARTCPSRRASHPEAKSGDGT